MADRVFVIAEAGVNHNGSLDRALAMVDAASAAGADAVKFQTFRSDKVVTAAAPKAAYQSANTGSDGSQLDMIRKLELSQDDFRNIAQHAAARGIEFMSTPFDIGSLQFLAGDLRVRRLKVPSGEITNALLLLAAARSGLPLIVSTGMSTLAEIEEALGVLASGMTRGGDASPKPQAWNQPAARAVLTERVTLLHCTTDYPAAPQDANLRAMRTMAERFGLPVGYSDHTLGTAVSVAAAALGATVIEKHFTLDRSLPGPDHRASLLPDELKSLVADARTAGVALGSVEKKPAASEMPNLLVARRSLVAARAIKRGETFDLSMLDAKRPASGLSPMRVFELIGRKAQRDYAPDDLIEL